MEDTYGKILWEGYGLKYYGGTRTRTGLICKTDVGLRELKKARSRREDLLFAHEVKTCLYRNGFSALSLFYTAQDGQPFLLGTAIFICWKTPCPPRGWRRTVQMILWLGQPSWDRCIGLRQTFRLRKGRRNVQFCGSGGIGNL